MTCTRIAGGIVCTSPTIKLRAGEKIEYFDMHWFCGPSPTDSEGELLDDFWDESSEFWPIFQDWMDAGQKVDSNGFGITSK